MTSADHGNLFLQKKLNGIKDEFKSQQNQAIQLQNIFDIESIQVEVLRTEISSNINIKSFQPSFSLQLGNQIKFNATNQYRDPFNAIFNEFFEFDCCNLQQMNKLFMKLYHINQLPPQQSPSQFQNKILIGQAALDVLTVQSQQTIKKQILSQDNTVIGYVYYKVQFRHQIKSSNQNINRIIQKQLNEQQNQSHVKQQQSSNPNNLSPKHFSSRIKQIQQQDEGKIRMNTDNTMQTNYSNQNNPDKEYQKMLEQTDEDFEQLIEIQGHYKKKSFDDLESTKRRELYPPFRQLNQANIKERGFSHAPEQSNQGQFQLYQQQLSQVPVSQFHSQKVNQANSNRMFKMFQNNSKQQKKQQPQNSNIPSSSQAHIQNSIPLQNQQINQQQQATQQNSFQQLNNQQPILQQNNQQVLQKQPSEIMQQLAVMQSNQNNLKSQFSKNMESQTFQQMQQQQAANQLQIINNDQALMVQQSQLEVQKLQLEINDLKNKITYDEQRIQLALQNINQSRRQVEEERIALKVKNDFLIEKLKIIEKEQLQYQEFMKITNEEENIIQQQINVVAQEIKKQKKSLIIKRAEYKILQKQHENKIKKIDSYYERINDYQKGLQKMFTINQKQRNKIENIKSIRKGLQQEEIKRIQQKRRYSLQDEYSQITFQIEDADYISVISPHENLYNLMDEKNEQRQLYLESIKEYQNQKEEYTHLIQMEQTVKEKLQNLQEKLSELGIQENNNGADIGEEKNNQDQSRGSYTQIIDQQSVISAESEQIMTQNHIYFRQNEEYQDQKEFQQQIRNMQLRQLLLEGNMQAQKYDYIKMAQGSNQEQNIIEDSQANYMINSNIANGSIDSRNINSSNSQIKIPNILQIQSSQRSQRGGNNMQQQFGHSLHNLSLQNNLIQKQQIHQQQQSQQLQHTHSAIIPNHYELTFKNQNEIKQQHFSKFKDQFESQMINQNEDQVIPNEDEILSDNNNNQQFFSNISNFSSLQNQIIQYQKQFQNNQNNQQNDNQARSKTPFQLKIDGPSFEQHIQSVTARNSPRLGYNQQINYHFQPIKSNEQLNQLQQVQNSSTNINIPNNNSISGNNINSNNNLNNGNYISLSNNQQTQSYQNAGQGVEETGSVRNKINRFEQKSVDLIYTSQSPYSVLNQNDFALQTQQQQQQQQQLQTYQQQQKSATPVNKKNKSDLDQIQLITNFSKEAFEDAASPEFLVGKNNNSQSNISMNSSSNNNSYSNGRMLFTQIVGQAQQQQQQALQQSQNSNSSLNERDYFGRYSNKSFDNLSENFSQLQVFQQGSQQNNMQQNRGISFHENNQSSNSNHQNFIQQQQQHQILQQQLLQQQQQQQQIQQIQNQQQQQQQLLQQNQIQQKQDLKSLREQYKAKQKNIQFVNQQQNNFISNNVQNTFQNPILINTSPTLFGKYFNDRATQQDQNKQ
ncbi:hypothetical protein ABPG74_020773 [Tetrahymena malaccensis]